MKARQKAGLGLGKGCVDTLGWIPEYAYAYMYSRFVDLSLQFSTLIDCIMSPASLTNLVSRGDECECDAEYMYVSIGHE